MSVKSKYAQYLAEYPLLTKCATAGVLAAVNEAIASTVAGDFQSADIKILGKKRQVRHIFSSKILSMVLYGALIATPISHLLYLVLNRVFKGKLTGAMKLVQIATSLLTISPVLSAAYVSFLSLINEYKYGSEGLTRELLRVAQTVRLSLKKSFWAVYRTSAQTSVVLLAVAQKFIAPQFWVPFFSVVYFAIGTFQNTRFKLRQREELRDAASQTDEKDKSHAAEEGDAVQGDTEPVAKTDATIVEEPVQAL